MTSIVLADRLIESPATLYSSPSRRAKKQVSYAESEDEDDAPFRPLSGNGRASKRRRISAKLDESEDEFGLDLATQTAMLQSDDGMSAAPLVCDSPTIRQSTFVPGESVPSAS